jgi:hypothetical protein
MSVLFTLYKSNGTALGEMIIQLTIFGCNLGNREEDKRRQNKLFQPKYPRIINLTKSSSFLHDYPVKPGHKP